MHSHAATACSERHRAFAPQGDGWHGSDGVGGGSGVAAS
mgnify:CR=1 FL=1